jgi:flagellar motor switch protein FliG
MNFAALSDPGSPAAGWQGQSSGLSGPEKAVVLVRLMLQAGADLPLRELPPDMQRRLVEQLGRMRRVTRADVDAVVEEFAAEIDSFGLTFPRGLHGALGLLDPHLSPDTASRLRRTAGLEAEDDPWITLAAMEVERLLPVVAAESTEVAAVILSKLSVAKAAEILGRLPGDRARRVAWSISLTGATRPETVTLIGRALLADLTVQTVATFEGGPAERVGAILNFSPSATRDDVLKGIDEEDAVFAEAVRKAIFTFANIPKRIDPRDVPKIVRAVEQKVLVTALAGATGAEAKAAEFLMASISQRMAASLKEDAAAITKLSTKDAEAAMTAIVVTIRELESQGEIFLVAEEEEEAE